MNSLKEFCFSSKNILSRLGVLWCRSLDKCQNGIQNTENDTISSCLQTLSYQHSLGNDIVGCHERSILGENLIWRLGNCSSSIGSSASVCQIAPSFCQWFASTGNDSSLRTSWLAKRRRMEKENKRSRTRRTHRTVQHGLGGARLLADGNVSEGGFTTVQPPTSQPDTGFLRPGSPEELKVAPLLARSNLLITRNIEWANLMLGFEQENRYAVVDPCYPQGPVGFICEQSNIFARQILRSRRPFIAYITDAMGNELFRVRRPFWWITSSIFAEVDGKEIGVVHRRWHLWRRVYDLYLGTQQFAVVENPGFWNWTFTVKDADGNALAAVDRDWRGFGFELLTDAGQYVIRFGNADPTFKTGPAKLIPDLEISRPLTLAERAIVVTLAVSLDNDYFSRHGGFGLPFLVAEE